MKKFLNIIFSLCFSLFLITTVIQFSVEYKNIYYKDIDKLNISEYSGLSKEEIILNYDYLIDYNLGKIDKDFEMPTIKSSQNGKIHFEEVREIVQNTLKISKIFFIISLIGIVINLKNKDISFLKTTSIMMVSIPILVGIPIMIDFNTTFTLFHKIMFDNDYWIFDPNLDPVINILPAEFFLHEGILIISLILIISIAIYGMYKVFNKKLS